MKFWGFRGVPGYQAFCNPESGTIEGLVASASRFTVRDIPVRQVLSRVKSEDSTPKKIEGRVIASNPENDQQQISFGFSTNEFSVLHSIKERAPVWRNISSNEEEGMRRVLTRYPTIRISGVSCKTSEQAKKAWESLATSFLFQLRTASGRAFLLSKEKNFRLPKIASTKRDPVAVEYPAVNYDFRAVNMYLYAGALQSTPTLQFLAFYQVVEFFYPQFSERKAQDIIARFAREPGFAANVEIRSPKLIAAVRQHISGKGFGSERQALHATVQAATTGGEIRDLLSKYDKEESFDKSLSKHALSKKMSDEDLLETVANRLYDIRCRIVHTKSDMLDHMPDVLLPFEDEAKRLGPDIALMAMVAEHIVSLAART